MTIQHEKYFIYEGSTKNRPCSFVIFSSNNLSVFSSEIFSDDNDYFITGLEVSIGRETPFGKVISCSPSPCTISVSTSINFSFPINLRTERLVHNVIVTIESMDVDLEKMERIISRDIFVYPTRAWDTIIEDIIDPFIRGSRSSSIGAILYGSSGTGKTSLIEIISKVYGLPTFKIAPYNIMSKYIGESERNLKKLFDEALKSEPSIIVAEESEWILAKRERFEHETTGSVRISLIDIILEYLDYIFKHRKKILFLATTNTPVSMLDHALLRSGRLGRPVYIPLPDYEAVYEFLIREGIDPKVAHVWATKSVNLSISMSDVKNYLLEKLKKNITPDLTRLEKQERGYRRYVFDLPSDPVIQENIILYMKELDKYLVNLSEAVTSRVEKGNRIVLHFAGRNYVSLAVANAYLSFYKKLPTVTLVDERYIDDSIEASNILRGFLIIPDNVLSSYREKAVENAMCVAYVGYKKSEERSITIPLIPRSISSRASIYDILFGLSAIVLTFYGVSYTKNDLQDLITLTKINQEKLIDLLDYAGIYGYNVGDLKSITMSF